MMVMIVVQLLLFVAHCWDQTISFFFLDDGMRNLMVKNSHKSH